MKRYIHSARVVDQRLSASEIWNRLQEYCYFGYDYLPDLDEDSDYSLSELTKILENEMARSGEFDSVREAISHARKCAKAVFNKKGLYPDKRDSVDLDSILREGRIDEFANDSNDYIRERVARYTENPEILAKLADDEYRAVRRQVALRADDPEILAKLADDEDYIVRGNVAFNPNTTDPETLAKLADDEVRDVREHVAGKITDPEILAKLADDESWLVRYAVADKTTDPEILAKLADDEDRDVRERASKKLKWHY